MFAPGQSDREKEVRLFKKIDGAGPEMYRCLEEMRSLLSRLPAEQQDEFFEAMAFCTREVLFDEHGVGTMSPAFIMRAAFALADDNKTVGIEDADFRAEVLEFWEKNREEICSG